MQSLDLYRIYIAIFVAVFLPVQMDIALGQENSGPPNTQVETVPFTPAAQALKWMRLPEGFKATLFAAEPDVHQPITATIDRRGRLWVVECYTYSDRKTNYDMSLNDRVVIFEDKDRDGKFDSKKVFWDQGKKLTGIEIGHDGVWLTAAPKFIFIADKNGDDIPDGPPTVLLDGFEDDTIRHNIVNGLRWGPDGWLYGRHGIQATSFVGKPGATASQRTALNCSIWRYHPMHHKFEVVAEGGTNPWGFDYDKHGEMFMINTVIGHLFHIVPGARYRRMYGSHFNPHTYQIIEQTADHFHWDQGESHNAVKSKQGMSSGTDAAGGGHAHTGLMIYQGTNWPKEYHNTLFTANFHGRRINNDTIRREGNSYVASHAADFMKTEDPWFRGVELLCGPNGVVYLLDWSDIGECHENDGIHRTSGRIFQISYEVNDMPGQLRNIATESDVGLYDLLFHADSWHFRQARQVIAERAIGGNLSNQMIERAKAQCCDTTTGPLAKLRILWALYSANLVDENLLLHCSRSEDEHLRAWSVRLMADGLKEISSSVQNRIVEMASDASGLVRLYVASSLNRFEFEDRLLVADVLCRQASDAADRVQPHLIWYGIEPALISQPTAAISLAKTSKIPLITENIVRRLTNEIDRQPYWVDVILKEIEKDRLDSNAALAGMSLALDGRLKVKQPANWRPFVEHFQNRDSINDQARDALRKLGVVFGDGIAIMQLEKMASNGKRSIAIRRQAIESWAATKPQGLAEKLKRWIGNRALTTAAVRAAVHSDDESVAQAIINQMKHMDPPGWEASINTLCSRESWALKLLSAVESGEVDKQLISAFHAQQMYQMDSEILRIRLENVWGKIRATPEQRQKEIAVLSESLANPKGPLVNFDPASGRKLFEQNCARCHVLYGQGGNTGPDLTGSDRKNLNYLLHNIIDPSGSVALAYRSSLISTEDGRVISGLVLTENENTIQVQTPEEVISLDRQIIDEIKLTEKSVMPEGLLNQMSLQQKANLFGYLMAPNQVDLPADNK